jgi:hypothetical protein
MPSDEGPKLQLTLLDGAFAVCQLGPTTPIPASLADARVVSITRTADELSVVCPEELAPAGAVSEGGWRCLAVRGPMPFSLTGILAAVAVPLANAGVSIFAVSTFDTDYVLVPGAQQERAIAALQSAGHSVLAAT